jgi:hypothetical protein
MRARDDAQRAEIFHNIFLRPFPLTHTILPGVSPVEKVKTIEAALLPVDNVLCVPIVKDRPEWTTRNEEVHTTRRRPAHKKEPAAFIRQDAATDSPQTTPKDRRPPRRPTHDCSRSRNP